MEKELLALLANPHGRYPAVHVAGTNGKGSVAAMVASILRCAGCLTGLYTSPHLVRFNERFLVNGVEIGDSDLEQAVLRIEARIPAVAESTGNEPTFFECSTAIAFDYFAARGVDLAVLETGMGGRLDATNVVTPLLSVITRIGLEHTAYLGADLETIAAEKAGIIKPGRPVVCGMMDPPARAVVRTTARDRNALFVDAEQTVSVSVRGEDLKGQILAMETEDASYGRVRLPLVGRHQAENAATAAAVIGVLNGFCGLNIAEDAVRQGLEAVSWPGRFQLLREDPPMILDGAHNPDAARALAATLGRLAKRRPIGLVAGMCADKDARGFLAAFRGKVEKLWAVPFKSERSMPPKDLRAIGEALNFSAEDTDLPSALKAASAWAEARKGLVCVTGSLFLVGEVLESGGP